MTSLLAEIAVRMDQAERKAWESLSGYKFWMFGYHAAQWVMLNQLLDRPRPNPFRCAVDLARTKTSMRIADAAASER